MSLSFYENKEVLAVLFLLVQLAALDGLGHVAGHHGQHELNARFLDGLLHSQALLQVGGQGLLAEDVLAGLGGGDAHGGVPRMLNFLFHVTEVVIRLVWEPSQCAISNPEIFTSMVHPWSK